MQDGDHERGERRLVRVPSISVPGPSTRSRVLIEIWRSAGFMARSASADRASCSLSRWCRRTRRVRSRYAANSRSAIAGIESSRARITLGPARVRRRSPTASRPSSARSGSPSISSRCALSVVITPRRDLARSHLASGIAPGCRGASEAVSSLFCSASTSLVQLRHRVACDDQRHDEDDRDDGEANRKPRAQGHVQCGVVRVMKRDKDGQSMPPFNPK